MEKRVKKGKDKDGKREVEGHVRERLGGRKGEGSKRGDGERKMERERIRWWEEERKNDRWKGKGGGRRKSEKKTGERKGR